MSDVNTREVLPLIALRGLAIFPQQTVHFEVGRKKSILALEEAMRKEQDLLLIPQYDFTVDDPQMSDLAPVGTVAKIKQILRAQGDTVRVLVEGAYRCTISELAQSKPFLAAVPIPVAKEKVPEDMRCQALCRKANALYDMYLEKAEYPAQAVQIRMLASKDPGFIADCIAQNSGMEFSDKAELLQECDPVLRLEMALHMLRHEMELLSIESDILEQTKVNMDRQQRDYFLREQMKVIQEQLGEDDDAEFAEIGHKIQQLKIESAIKEKLLKDVQRLAKQPYGSAEASVLRNYLDTVLDLPWNIYTKERVDVNVAGKILEKDHFGMEKVKQRILESIAVRQMAPDMPPQILCLVGPPGVGKTSIAYSIARALNRKLARISLGGIHDESDIRGHRKTYVGAMPGRIMTALMQAGTSNPVLLLDEIDKMGSDYRGDPSAALLEVLDAEQNKTYRDHYLEIPFDLSDVMFITTANTLDTVPRPLLDRMEIIELGSYTDEEKRQIAKAHLLPKQLKNHGLKKSQLRITDDAIGEIIGCYTRESGVRNLERNIASVCRKADKMLLDGCEKRIVVTDENIEDFLGVRKFLPDRIPGTDQIGLVTGLAWTSVGGEVLEVEVNVMEGSGKLELTGNLGTVMKESAQAAVSYIRANAEKLGISGDFYKTKDIHVHFPEGAVPKDGPSAGVTVCTAIVSALTGTRVRRDVAMTGEISIRGRVLPIGGLKEKTMAALRHGIHTVIIPKDNEKSLQDIDPSVRKALNFITAETVDTVLEAALRKEPSIPSVLSNIPVVKKTRSPDMRQ